MAAGAGSGKASSPHDGQKGARARQALQRHTHGGLLSPARAGEKKFPTSLQNRTIHLRPSLQHVSLWRAFPVQTTPVALVGQAVLGCCD